MSGYTVELRGRNSGKAQEFREQYKAEWSDDVSEYKTVGDLYAADEVWRAGDKVRHPHGGDRTVVCDTFNGLRLLNEETYCLECRQGSAGYWKRQGYYPAPPREMRRLQPGDVVRPPCGAPSEYQIVRTLAGRLMVIALATHREVKQAGPQCSHGGDLLGPDWREWRIVRLAEHTNTGDKT